MVRYLVSEKYNAAVRFDVLISNFLDSALNIAPYIGHTDAIWDFKLLPTTIADYVPLVSASADGTVKIWDTSASGNLLKSSWSYNGVIDEHQEEQSKLKPHHRYTLDVHTNKLIQETFQFQRPLTSVIPTCDSLL